MLSCAFHDAVFLRHSMSWICLRWFFIFHDGKAQRDHVCSVSHHLNHEPKADFQSDALLYRVTQSSLLSCWIFLLPRVAQVELLLDVIHPDFVPWYGAPSMLHVAAYHRRMGVVACLLVADLKLLKSSMILKLNDICLGTQQWKAYSIAETSLRRLRLAVASPSTVHW